MKKTAVNVCRDCGNQLVPGPDRLVQVSRLQKEGNSVQAATGKDAKKSPLPALGFVPPWLAAIGMSLSSVVVVLNAMRLSRGTAPRRRPGQSATPRMEAA